MLLLLPDAFSDLLGDKHVAAECELLLVEHIEQVAGRMVTGSEFWEYFDWSLDGEYNSSNFTLQRGRAWFCWAGEPVVRLDYSYKPRKTSGGIALLPDAVTISKTKYHASTKEEDYE